MGGGGGKLGEGGKREAGGGDDVHYESWGRCLGGCFTLLQATRCRHFDSADIYGASESLLGEFRRQYESGDDRRIHVWTKFAGGEANLDSLAEVTEQSRRQLAGTGGGRSCLAATGRGGPSPGRDGRKLFGRDGGRPGRGEVGVVCQLFGRDGRRSFTGNGLSKRGPKTRAEVAHLCQPNFHLKSGVLRATGSPKGGPKRLQRWPTSASQNFTETRIP